MIKSWKHKGLKEFYLTGSTAGIIAEHARRLKIILQLLDVAENPEDLNLPGFHFHGLKGEMKEYFSVKVNASWRVIYQFEDKNALLLNYLNYH